MTIPIEGKPTTQEVVDYLLGGLKILAAAKPNDRSNTDRNYAICVTELEKVVAYYTLYIHMADRLGVTDGTRAHT